MNLIKEFVQDRLQKQKSFTTHNNDEVTIIGNLPNLQLLIYPNEKIIVPHFHFVNTKTSEKGALKLLEPEYCFHDDYTATLDKEQLEELYNYLNNVVIAKRNVIEYDFIYAAWGINNENRSFKKPSSVPEYYKI